MSNLYDKLYEDLKACALSAIPVDSDDGTTFIRTDGAAPIWGPPEVVADAVASATYTVVGIRLDDARAEGVAAGRTAEDVRILAIVAAEPWLLHRPAECVNVRCTEGRWCIGCDPNGETDCAEHPWPCPVVREQNPAWAAGRKQAAAEIRDAIWAAKPSVCQFWDTADAARVYALNDAAKIADRIAEGGEPNA